MLLLVQTLSHYPQAFDLQISRYGSGVSNSKKRFPLEDCHSASSIIRRLPSIPPLHQGVPPGGHANN